jgi:hypothetical protein
LSTDEEVQPVNCVIQLLRQPLSARHPASCISSDNLQPGYPSLCVLYSASLSVCIRIKIAKQGLSQLQIRSAPRLPG